MIRLLCREDLGEEAVVGFCKMMTGGFLPENFVILNTLEACSSAQLIQRGSMDMPWSWATVAESLSRGVCERHHSPTISSLITDTRDILASEPPVTCHSLTNSTPPHNGHLLWHRHFFNSLKTVVVVIVTQHNGYSVALCIYTSMDMCICMEWYIYHEALHHFLLLSITLHLSLFSPMWKLAISVIILTVSCRFLWEICWK